MQEYPPEYDEPIQCEVCLKNADHCDCPECPVCGNFGNPECYRHEHIRPCKDSVQALCDHIGIEPIEDCLRAVDEHNTEHIWLVFHGPLPELSKWKNRVYYHDDEALKVVKPWMRLRAVGVGGIAWDGSDWEWSNEGALWELDDLLNEFHEALEEYLD